MPALCHFIDSATLKPPRGVRFDLSSATRWRDVDIVYVMNARFSKDSRIIKGRKIGFLTCLIKSQYETISIRCNAIRDNYIASIFPNNVGERIEERGVDRAPALRIIGRRESLF